MYFFRVHWAVTGQLLGTDWALTGYSGCNYLYIMMLQRLHIQTCMPLGM